jgi:chitinase
MEENKIINSYYNDGYVYCLLTPIYSSNNKLAKIGKIEMKRSDTEQQVINKLIRRYNTYYSDKYEIIHFERVGNCHDAEKMIFNILNNLHYKRELYKYDEDKMSNAFDIMTDEYPCIQKLLCKTGISILSNTNKILRQDKK